MGEGTTEPTIQLLSYLPDAAWLEDQVLFGMLYYDHATKTMAMQPWTIITDDQLIRLMY